MKSWLALTMIGAAVAAWACFGALASRVASDRAEYADARARAEEESTRGENATRLRSTIESTTEERAALEQLFAISVLQAVEVIEQSVRAAGARDVAIGDASSESNVGDLRAFSMVVNANGSFAALSRAVSLLETLPIPASLEGLEIEKLEEGNDWRLTARLRILMASPTL